MELSCIDIEILIGVEVFASKALSRNAEVKILDLEKTHLILPKKTTCKVRAKTTRRVRI